MRRCLRIVFFLAAATTPVLPAWAETRERLLPTVFEAGHFYAVPTLPDGQQVRLLVDSGGGGFGGLYVVTKELAARAGARVFSCNQDEFKVDVAEAVSFRPGLGLPVVATTRPCAADATVVGKSGFVGTADGILGSGYLSHFIWTFDYPERKMLLEPETWQADPQAERIPLSFAHDASGKRVDDFPAITVIIDGAPVTLLFDTGATALPTDSGESVAQIPTVKGEGVASYIITTQLERWHRDHPGWRVVARGDRLIANTRLIEVPEVLLGRQHIGPVWFTERPDVNFGPGGVSGYMGQTVVGAAGANIYGTFRVTIDYPHEALWVTR